MFVQIMTVGPKLVLSLALHALHGLYRENMIKSSCKKLQGLKLDIWYVASLSGQPPSCSNNAHGAKVDLPRSHISLYDWCT